MKGENGISQFEKKKGDTGQSKTENISVAIDYM